MTTYINRRLKPKDGTMIMAKDKLLETCKVGSYYQQLDNQQYASLHNQSKRRNVLETYIS